MKYQLSFKVNTSLYLWIGILIAYKLHYLLFIVISDVNILIPHFLTANLPEFSQVAKLNATIKVTPEIPSTEL